MNNEIETIITNDRMNENVNNGSDKNTKKDEETDELNFSSIERVDGEVIGCWITTN